MMLETEFLRSVSLDENPFETEQPDEEHFYDLNGEEVTENGSEQ